MQGLACLPACPARRHVAAQLEHQCCICECLRPAGISWMAPWTINAFVCAPRPAILAYTGLGKHGMGNWTLPPRVPVLYIDTPERMEAIV